MQRNACPGRERSAWPRLWRPFPRISRASLAWLLALWLALVGALPIGAQAPEPTGGPQTDVASYSIQVSLDATSKQLRGTERLTYHNPSRDSLNEVWLRLYLNAFRSPDTRWMREAGGEHRGFSADSPGWIKLERLVLVETGTALPLPGNDGDTEETIVRLPLPAPLAPGQTLALDIAWTAQLPKVFARTGYADDFVMAGQWYPKLAVYDRGAWDSEPWHAASEFFADFGNYDLAVTVPDNYVTGASGVRQGEAANADGSKTVRYYAERVTDVAWTAWPSFVVYSREVEAAGVRTQLELLLPPGEQGQAERHLAAAGAALDAYGGWYGAYPWPKLTVVVPPPEASGAGGMEYPTLVTTGTNGFTAGLPALDQGIHGLEVVTVHEIAHQWFPMQVQSNEAREAWLDEGFADYLTTRVLARMFGADRSLLDLPGLRLSYLSQQRAQVESLAVAREPLATPSWQFASFNAYAATVYSKGTLALSSLEGLLGDERFTAALRHYVSLWRWRHPTSADLLEVLSQDTEVPLAWFFADFVFGKATVEFGVANVDAEQAVVARLGESRYPVDVRLTFADGTSRTQRWDGATERLALEGGGRAIAAVAVDPDERLALEMNRLDNARVLNPDPAPTLALSARWLALVQQLLQLLGQVG